jgi:hypothetical protein
MPNDEIQPIKDKIGPIKEKKFESMPYLDTMDRQSKDSMVNPVGRVASVRAQAPAEEQTSIFTPDKSENYNIRAVAPADRK